MQQRSLYPFHHWHSMKNLRVDGCLKQICFPEFSIIKSEIDCWPETLLNILANIVSYYWTNIQSLKKTPVQDLFTSSLETPQQIQTFALLVEQNLEWKFRMLNILTSGRSQTSPHLDLSDHRFCHCHHQSVFSATFFPCRKNSCKEIGT